MENAPLLNAIIQNAIDGIITITENGVVELINPSACKLFGYSPEEVIGNNLSMLMQSPDKDRHDTYLQRYQQTGIPHIIGTGREVTGLKKRRERFPFQAGRKRSSIG
ncbi:MAG TPA: PAS domain S-box protein [Mucilaginibacter sp.]|nr:PAS domain S-box protein [Mucilaginibacter sp.]